MTEIEQRADQADESLGASMRRWRESANLSLAEMARRVNYSRGYLSKVETGRAPGSVSLADQYDLALGADGALGRLARVICPPPADAAPSTGPTTQPEEGVSFVLAVDRAHNALRGVARSSLREHARQDAANRVVHDSAVYSARERLLISADLAVVEAGEDVFLRLIDLRNAVNAGADLDSQTYHAAYHRFAEAVWRLRLALRTSAGQPPFGPAWVRRADWSDRERCGCGELITRQPR
ncbi:helix-turn-helix transcriptional regulator [Kribbella sp. NPDC056861]|uniref:helix-turn-helix domain-containing protein n=1 Tax=Kribbella sp. NPDC056861 TaxID=3154857 RepID=UPI003418F75F